MGELPTRYRTAGHQSLSLFVCNRYEVYVLNKTIGRERFDKRGEKGVLIIIRTILKNTEYGFRHEEV